MEEAQRKRGSCLLRRDGQGGLSREELMVGAEGWSPSLLEDRRLLVEAGSGSLSLSTHIFSRGHCVVLVGVQTGEGQARSCGNTSCLMDLSPWLATSPSPSVPPPDRQHARCFGDSSVVSLGL